LRASRRMGHEEIADTSHHSRGALRPSFSINPPSNF
jgi:hypothetical protein